MTVTDDPVQERQPLNMANYDFGDVLLVESDGPVRVVTMNRPAALNAFAGGLHEAIADVWARIASDRDARAVVLTGAGRAFSAGGDIPGMAQQIADPEHRRHSMREARRLSDEVVRFHLPVVAAVNGPAVGLGATIAVMSDIVLIADTAFLADPHVQVGLVAGDGGAAFWPLATSILRAKEYLLTGDRIPADQAVALGLANRVVPAAELMDEARRVAHKIAALPPQAVQDTKRAINLHLAQAARLVLDFSLAAEGESFTTDELRHNVESFKAKS
ncbi:enoyl-CoA hydratase/isomerase family protein [Frankia sp. Cr2]|uniref:enoyl-CoA hydratase/isomerase family protein n=1 Tax=Frankia sp. Cr2 TaxID=3073932 RepID=UPI002AD59701|nr:enoyl-CoA hydratase/isomerase family protein [Frankia sp. Cr2]